MATGGFGSDVYYSGKVIMVKKAFGLVQLDGGMPASTAYFDRSSLDERLADLTERFAVGCKVKSCLKHVKDRTGIKYKATGLMLASQDDKEIRGGDYFLKKHLEDGAVEINKLACDLIVLKSGCPRFLRRGDVNDIKKVVDFRPEWFQIKNDFVCLTFAEVNLLNEISYSMVAYNNKISLTALNGIIRPDHQYRRYLHSTGQGVKDFVVRNANLFVLWDDAIWNRQELTDGGGETKEKFQKDMIAVKFYAQFVTASGALPVTSLMSHYEQADDEIIEAAGNSEDDFKEFLNRNAFFFTLQDEGNTVKECPKHRLDAASKYWCKRKPKLKALSSCSTKPQSQSTKPATSAAQNSASTPPQEPIQVFKAFDDLEAETASNEADEISFRYMKSYLESAVDPVLVQSPGCFDVNGGLTHNIYSHPEAQAFKTTVGDEIALAIEKEIPFGDSLNSLILLRLNAGVKPKAKFQICGKDSVNITLNVGPVQPSDLNRMLEQGNIFKTESSRLYGVKSTLHSIRTVNQGGKLTGLSLFCQLHEAEDGLALDIWQRKKLTAVFPGGYPDKCISNYLRYKSETLSEEGDVLVIDMDGKLSGCDDLPHPSLGNVARVVCFSLSDFSKVITESVQHMHDYVIIKGIYAIEDLQAVRKLCRAGTTVYAEVYSDLKSEVDAMFS